MEENFSIIKYFLYNTQYIHLNSYCLMTKWWIGGKNLRFFLLGHCCLFFNNIDQSISLFLKASYNLEKDQYLKILMKLSDNKPSLALTVHQNRSSKPVKVSRRSIVINSNSGIKKDSDSNFDMDDENLMLLDYYTKIIHYYDLNGNLEAAIELIQNALLKCQFDLKSKSKLYCILFKSYMDLEHFDKAHMALMSNLDQEWKKTCLEHFINELCNQNKTDILVSFEYGDLLLEVLNLLYKRAQQNDLRTNDYYRVLYSIYVKIKDYRKAAFCMYECYLRLSREIQGINSLKRQERCLLTCLNLLKLVDKKYAWLSFLIPKLDNENVKKSNNINELSFKLLNNQSGSSELAINNADLEIKVVDSEEINRNYLIVFYMIKLSTLIPNQGSISN